MGFFVWVGLGLVRGRCVVWDGMGWDGVGWDKKGMDGEG